MTDPVSSALLGRGPLRSTASAEPLHNRSSSVTGKPHKEWLYLGLLVAIVSLTWCAHYGRWTVRAWKTPVDYFGARSWDMTFAGDNLWGLAATKLMADGEISFWDKRPASLGAPFGANWNDWPSVEEGVNAWWALLARGFGLGNGSNLAAMSGFLFAGVAFYFVCRILHYDRLFSLAGAILFGLSRFAFWRSLPNLSLTFYWHLPLGLLVAWWCTAKEPIVRDRKKLVLCIVTPILFGIQSPYYSGMFLQLLFWAALFALIRSRRWQSLLLPCGLGAVLFATLVLVNLDTLSSNSRQGSNGDVIRRWYSDLEKYALRPTELFLPRSHSLNRLERWTNENYVTKTLVGEEIGSAYAGLVACCAAFVLAYTAAKAVAKGIVRDIPIHFWGVCMVATFSVVGGINGLIGLGGVWLFRASDRYSIVIFTLLLLFLVRWLTEVTRNWSRLAAAVLSFLIITVGIYDQVPPRHPERERDAQELFRDDRRLVSKMEETLPKGSKVFQLPVFPFPEGLLEQPKLGTMEDYEQFRPYIHSHNTRFSYGDTKGRYENRWQREAEQLGPVALIRLLETYGFGAILLNREGYDDRGVEMLTELRSGGAREIVASSTDFVCLALNPARRSTLPPVFGEGWFELEVKAPATRRLCSGDGILTLFNRRNSPKSIHLLFGLEALSQRCVKVSTREETLYQMDMAVGEIRKGIEIEVRLKPGRNEILFSSDKPGALLGNGDPRILAFGLLDFRVEE